MELLQAAPGAFVVLAAWLGFNALLIIAILVDWKRINRDKP